MISLNLYSPLNKSEKQLMIALFIMYIQFHECFSFAVMNHQYKNIKRNMGVWKPDQQKVSLFSSSHTEASNFLFGPVSFLKEGKRTKTLLHQYRGGGGEGEIDSSYQEGERIRKYSQNVMPITIISGFLGSGKTTLLSNLINKKETNEKFAVIVNDVASINIDSKLLSSETPFNTDEPIINLSNGCACCSLQEDLLLSISELITLSDLRYDDDKFDRIIIECSGISNPQSIRSLFQNAQDHGMPLMERIKLDSMITIVDASSILDHVQSDKLVSLESSPELFPQKPEEYKEIPDDLLELLGMASSSSGPEEAGVSSLLAAQIEIADVILINKIDLISDQEENKLALIQDIIKALNPLTRVFLCKYSQVENKELFQRQGIIADAGVVDDHRSLVHSIENKAAVVAVENPNEHDHKHEHKHEHKCEHEHDHSHAHHEEPCTEDSHDHSHSHSAEAHTHDTGHSHAHKHEHKDKLPVNDSLRKNSNSHEHSHEHSHSHEHLSHLENCSDPNCSHPAHQFEHSYISSFVYKARRPFHPQRLLNKFINTIFLQKNKYLLRSKGFCWLANSHDTALFLSFAGREYDISILGRWWATVIDTVQTYEQEIQDVIMSDFIEDEHVGDRRQELVFIGHRREEFNHDEIIQLLNDCLLTDEEMTLYTKSKDDEDKLGEIFSCPDKLIDSFLRSQLS